MNLRILASGALLFLAAGAACRLGGSRCEAEENEFRCGQVDDDLDTLDSGAEDDACYDGDEAAIVRIENRTGNTIENVSFVRCDGSDPSDFPLMPPGLADGDDVEIPLPDPGCWLLQYSGDGCEGAEPHETDMEVCAGDTYVWTVDDLNHECVG